MKISYVLGKLDLPILTGIVFCCADSGLAFSNQDMCVSFGEDNFRIRIHSISLKYCPFCARKITKEQVKTQTTIDQFSI